MVSGVSMIKAANSNQLHTDIIQPFYIENLGVRGHFVRLHKSITQIVQQHDYPFLVSKLLVEALLDACLLGANVKTLFNLNIQIQGDGAIGRLQADYFSGGKIRAYAAFDKDMIKKWTGGSEDIDPFLLAGSGHMAVTVTQTEQSKPSQGIAALRGRSLKEAMMGYLQGSEQITSSIKLGIFQDPVNQDWRAGGVFIQKIASTDMQDEQQKNWEHADILLQSLTEEELCDTQLSADRLLYRLYHQEDVFLGEKASVQFGCHCRRERVKSYFDNLSKQELQKLLDENNNAIQATCQFCSQTYEFTASEF